MRVDDEWPENTCVDGGKRAKIDENDVRRPEKEENARCARWPEKDENDGWMRGWKGRRWDRLDGAGKAVGSDGAKRCGILDVAGWGNLAKEISRL